MRDFLLAVGVTVVFLAAAVLATPWAAYAAGHYIGQWIGQYDDYVKCKVTGRKCP